MSEAAETSHGSITESFAESCKFDESDNGTGERYCSYPQPDISFDRLERRKWNGLFELFFILSLVVGGDGDESGGRSHEGVKQGDHLWHLGHLDGHGKNCADNSSDEEWKEEAHEFVVKLREEESSDYGE